MCERQGEHKGVGEWEGGKEEEKDWDYDWHRFSQFSSLISMGNKGLNIIQQNCLLAPWTFNNALHVILEGIL